MFQWKFSQRLATIALCSILLICFTTGVFGLQVKLETNLPSGQPVGTPVLLTASVWDAGFPPPSYQFSYRPVGGEWKIVRDFNIWNVFEWAALEEGLYELRVVAASPAKLEFADDQILFLITSRATGSVPVISTTRHPLVALYSHPPCIGGGVRVTFSAVGSLFSQQTPVKPCVPGKSVNFYVAGMRADTTYLITQERVFGSVAIPGLTLPFHTGIPDVSFPLFEISIPPGLDTSLQDGILLSTYVLGPDPNTLFPIATDLAGNIVWYYDKLAGTAQIGSVIPRPVEGGTMLIIMKDQAYEGQVLREIDLAGNIVRETHARRVSRQLLTLGQDPIGSFHHEAIRLPNGHTLVIGSVERLMTDVQGEGTVDIYGEMVIDLDENFQVSWVWNAFDHLDVTRKAILDEVCTMGGGDGGCPPLFFAEEANDWLHANAIDYVPEDGSILISLRHQDWVIKVNYDNGNGDGSVIWRLGKDGDFTFISEDPEDDWPWFSHQHDARFQGDELVVYDNGNTRVEAGPGGNSRGQVLLIDEENMEVRVRSYDLGSYAFALGSAQKLRNGNYHFLNGLIDADEGGYSESIEVSPDGQFLFMFSSEGAIYRSHRMKTLYQP